MLDQVALEELFGKYWKDSFPMAPANKQSAASHVAFAQFTIEEFKKKVQEEWAKKPYYEGDVNEG